jgi:rhodanese-related sulfurtransferase
LADDITVYPAHGAGSACGKNMMKETIDSLGNQKRMNYALNQPNKEAFITAVLDGLLPPPAYFGMNVAMNKKGYKSFDEVMKKGFVALDAIEFESLADTTDALILDTRSADVFAKGFIPSSVNIGIKGDFAPWVGALIGDVEQNILLVCEDGMEEESITRLARVGFDNVLGYLKGGVKTWIDANKEIDTVNRISAKQFEAEFKPKESVVFDIRKESEYTAEHIDEAYNKPLSFINEWINNIDTDQHFYIHCQGGYRSMIGASILQARGIRNFSEVEGGFKEIANTSIPKTDFVCQSKMMSV